MDEKRPDIEFWKTRYAEEHTPWDLGETSGPVKELVRDHFPSDGSVLVPGCGRGYEVLHLARLGYRVTAVDWAAEPLRFLGQAAEEEGLNIETREENIFALPEGYDGTFDVFLEQTCLCALPPEQWGAYAELAFRALKPGGLLAGVFMELESDDGPPFDCPPEKVQALLAAPRWEFLGLARLPQNPGRPGPEYTARFVKGP